MMSPRSFPKALSLSGALFFGASLTLAACSRDAKIAIPEAEPSKQGADGTQDPMTPPYSGEMEGAIDGPIDGIIPTSPESPMETPAPIDPSTPPTTPTPTPTPTPVVPPPTPDPVPTPMPPLVKGTIADGVYTIVSTSSNRCLDVPEGTSTNGRQLQLWDCLPGSSHQMFTIQWIQSKEAYRIRSSTGKQLVVPKDSTAAERPLEIGDLTDEAHGLFVVDKAGSETLFHFRLRETELVFDVVNFGTENGTPIKLTRRANPFEAEQQWKLVGGMGH